MSGHTFTPGPWDVIDSGDAYRLPRVFAHAPTALVAVVGHSDQAVAQAAADASLIASAPELLDACRAAKLSLVKTPIVRRADHWPYSTCLGCGAIENESCKPDCWCLRLESSLVDIRAAIAKAEGKT